MPSKLRFEASGRNGARSRGPIPPEEKLASAQSNLKHGLSADTVTIDAECTERFLSSRKLFCAPQWFNDLRAIPSSKARTEETKALTEPPAGKI
jgi:hypothetical protein